MKLYPPGFSSQKEYDSYFNCLSRLKPGDRVFYNSSHGPIEATFLYKEILSGIIPIWSIIVGSRFKYINFWAPSPSEKKCYLIPAKKLCPSITVNSTYITRLLLPLRIEKIHKYYGQEKEKKAKKESRPKKSLRASSEDA